jgi:hypothetical protein
VALGYWDVLTDQVHSSGRSTARCGTDWEDWSNGVRTFLGDAADSVLDGAINEALSTRAGDINQAAGRLATDVVADGENVAGAACDINAGDQDAAGSMEPAILINESVSALVSNTLL